MPVYKWSQTAGANAGSDPNFTWAEGMAPSAVNDSARAQTAEFAKYRDDIAGAIVTGGSSTAYTVASYSGFDTLAHLNGQMIAFTPHTTNGATVLLNVDGLGQKPLRTSPGVELLAGTIIQGTPYVATYNNTDGAFYLQSFFGASPYLIPLAAGMDFWGTTTPNSSFAFPAGQAISRTTYATLFALLSTTFGVGDGSTTFNLPDVRGRVVAGVDNMGGSAAGRLTSASGMGTGLLGQVGGSETKTLVTANLPAYTPSVGVSVAAPVITNWNGGSGIGSTAASGGGAPIPLLGLGIGASASLTGPAPTVTVTPTAQGGTSTPVATIMPSIAANRILRII